MSLRCEQRSWKECGPLIRELTRKNPYLTPYCYESFLSIIKDHPNIHARRAYRRCEFRCFVISENERDLAVAPLFFDDRQKKIFLMGEFSSVGHGDLIYDKSLTARELANCITHIGKNYPGYTFCLNQVSQFSLTAAAMQEIGIAPTKQDTCVKIDYENYANWYAALRKSCRQNLRTGYNRLTAEGYTPSFRLYVRQRPGKEEERDAICLFSKRILEHSRLPSVMTLPMRLLKKRDAITKALFASQDQIFASLYFNDSLAANCHGVIANDGRAIITRLSIQTELKKYSPGGLLINELIKACAQNYPEIRSIDLSRGDEPYKYTYGGVEHYNYSFELTL